MCPGLDSQTQRHMWVEFVVGFLLCSERVFSGYSGFPISSKTNISKFHFDPGEHGHFCTSSCELLGAPQVNKLLLHFFIYIVTCYHHYFPCDSTFLVLICVSLKASRNQEEPPRLKIA